MSFIVLPRSSVGNPTIKPKKWGPPDAVRYAVRANCERIGLPMPLVFTPCWGFEYGEVFYGNTVFFDEGIHVVGTNGGHYFTIPSPAITLTELYGLYSGIGVSPNFNMFTSSTVLRTAIMGEGLYRLYGNSNYLTYANMSVANTDATKKSMWTFGWSRPKYVSRFSAKDDAGFRTSKTTNLSPITEVPIGIGERFKFEWNRKHVFFAFWDVYPDDKTDELLHYNPYLLLQPVPRPRYYFLPSVNHWELQIKVDDGEWTNVPNMSSEIAEYIKSTGLISGTYYARIRKFTNGVPSDWEYAPGVVYSAGGGGTPYSLAQDLLSSFSSIIGFSVDSVSSVSTDMDIIQDGKAAISNSFIVSQDSILRGSNIFVISQDGELSASNLFYGSQDSRTKSITLWSDSQDVEGKISSEWNKNQDSNLSSSTVINKNQDGSVKIHEYIIQNFDGKSTFLTKIWMNHDCVSKVSSDINFIFDSKAVISSLSSYYIEMDALSKVSQKNIVNHDARLDTSFVYNLHQDSKSVISVIGYWSISCDSVAKVSSDFVLTEDTVSKISSALTDSFDSKVTSSSKIAIDQDHHIIVKTALQFSFDSEGKVASTYEEFQEAVSGISSGYAIIQDGRVHSIQVDFSQLAKVDLESFGVIILGKESLGLDVLQIESESEVVKSLESKTRISIIKI